MESTAQHRLSAGRVSFMTLLVLAACAGMVVAVRSLPATPLGYALAFVLGIPYLLVQASVLEWLVHRYVYHRRWLPVLRRIYAIHHHGHHHAIFPTWRYVTNGTPHRHAILSSSVSSLHATWWRNALVEMSHCLWYLGIGLVCVWTPAWLLTQNAWFVAGLVATSIVIADLFVRVHDAIHYPGTQRLLRGQPWFGFLERHHYVHHVDTEANVNFLLPLADLLFGTLRTELTTVELAAHGSLADAKAHPVGHSEPARLVAHPRGRLEPTLVGESTLHATA